MPGTVGKDGKRLTHRVVMRRSQAAALEANARIVAGRECIADQRKAYQLRP